MVPQTALTPVVTWGCSSGPLNFAAHSPEDSKCDRKCRSARLQRIRPKGLFQYRTADFRVSATGAPTTLCDRRRNEVRGPHQTAEVPATLRVKRAGLVAERNGPRPGRRPDGAAG